VPKRAVDCASASGIGEGEGRGAGASTRGGSGWSRAGAMNRPLA